jgi:hypothetical protein
MEGDPSGPSAVHLPLYWVLLAAAQVLFVGSWIGERQGLDATITLILTLSGAAAFVIDAFFARHLPPEVTNDVAVEVIGLRKSFGEKVAVDGVDEWAEPTLGQAALRRDARIAQRVRPVDRRRAPVVLQPAAGHGPQARRATGRGTGRRTRDRGGGGPDGGRLQPRHDHEGDPGCSDAARTAGPVPGRAVRGDRSGVHPRHGEPVAPARRVRRARSNQGRKLDGRGPWHSTILGALRKTGRRPGAALLLPMLSFSFLLSWIIGTRVGDGGAFGPVC